MSLNPGLSVSDVVNVSVSLAPTAAAQRNFGSLLILGDSGVIDPVSRYRLYTSLSAVATDFGTTAPEYLAAAIAFGQTPTLAQLYIGAWARAASPGYAFGAPLTTAQQALSNFTSITFGTMTWSVNGSPYTLVGVNLSGATSLAGVASIIQTALTADSAPITFVWNAAYSFFQATTTTTGSTAQFGLPTGTVAAACQMTSNSTPQGAYYANGITGETPLACVTALANLSNAWYGVAFAASTMPVDSDYVAIAGFIQGLSVSRIFGVCSQEPAVITSGTADIAYQLQQLNYTRTFVQYSSTSPYAQMGIFGDAFTTNFNGSNTLYTLKFKTETGVTPETLTETQNGYLLGKNCNVYVNYAISTTAGLGGLPIAILQNGTMASGQYFDVIHGMDWLQNYVQTTLFNILYTAGTKVPLTNAGVGILANGIATCCEQAQTNGLIAAGVWYGPAVGTLVYGQTLSQGYYIYVPSVSTLSASARAARQAPVITVCLKLAGAVHSVSCILNVST